ncbi:hypothetical protein GCM10010441_13270 [Kitasatospora paracochleata]|uniref:Uncharacterized protein n=1 Tax=Kitasatospora paracochleata TaxID=58354 RepID=A0ABT1JAU1_9ACTN|nr:hypothetical protein [Kitasatospora paracochleata]MCP2314573.1 hypothetical protein [Kitasatospora paracochleata]
MTLSATRMGAVMAIGRAGAVFLALGVVGVAVGGVTAMAFGRDSGAVVVQEDGLVSPDLAQIGSDPAALEAYLRAHPVSTPMMGEQRTR